jgi:ribosomal protein S27AE
VEAWEGLKKRYRRGFGTDMRAICKSGAKAGPLLEAACKVALELEAELKQYYPPRDGKTISHYIWAKQVKCPKCGELVPLVLNSSLDVKRGYIWRPVYSGNDYQVIIERGDGIGTVREGEGRCPKCGAPIPNRYIRENVAKTPERAVVVVTEDKEFLPARPEDVPHILETKKIDELIVPDYSLAARPPYMVTRHLAICLTHANTIT